MKRRLLTGSAALLLVGGTILAVFCYNTWSLCCGRCTAATFLTPGPFGLALLALNLLAVVLLAGLKLHRRLSLARFRCRCGATLVSGWLFCPDCGSAVEHLAEK
jgi:hypothetical protein